MSVLDEQPILGGMHICRPRPHQYTEPLGLRLMSDLHIGAAHVDYGMIREELGDALENNDRILINGDLLDLILPKDMKRYQPGSPHPRIATRNDQVNASVEWAVELLSPVAHLIDMIGVGNHETAIAKFHSIDPTLLVVYFLEEVAKERDPEHVIHYGGYTGFVDYRLRRKKNSSKRNTDRACTDSGRRWVLYYHHGSGGAAPVTKGMIDFNRKDVFVDADAIWMGHKHQAISVKCEKIRCPLAGDQPDVRSVRHIMTGAYFNTYVGQSQTSIKKHGRRSNYAADMGLAPGGKGGVRVVIEMDSKDDLGVKVIQ